MNYSIKLNESNFDEFIRNEKVCIVYIKASWCGPCKSLSPIVEHLAREKQNEVYVGLLDADEDMEFVKSLNVRNIPTLLFYKRGEIKERSVGLKSRNDLNKIIEDINPN